MLKLCKIITIAFLMLVSGKSFSHDCVAKKDQVSFHFTNYSVVSVLYYISQYTEKDLVIKTGRIPSGSFHYNCVEWQTILADLASKYRYKIEVTNNRIILRDK
jgi:hypothetical protein